MNKQRTCTVCVMNNTALDISYDRNGQCNYCSDFQSKLNFLKKKKRLNKNNLIKKIKLEKKNTRYDCIVGLSGGLDSSYALVKAVESGLKPLVVHMDNGWNSELSQNNIENLVKVLNVDLYTHVLDWDEYKNMMNAFFDSDVLDVELLMDNAMYSVNYRMAKIEKLKFIITGSNAATEGMAMPKNFNWMKFDKKNIKSIINIFGNAKIQKYPFISVYDLIIYILFYRIKWVHFLDYFNYDKIEAIKYLEKNFNFKSYPYKHYESVFTRFYQGYILPKKFGIDKRILHLSNLIVTNQLSREQAINDLKLSPYPSNKDLEEDKEYFLKKMGWTEQKLEDYIKRPAVSHGKFGNNRILYDALLKFYKYIKL